jgi:hypothetical protein
MDNYGIVTFEQQEELRDKIKAMQRMRPQSIRSMARECSISHVSLSHFLKGKDVNWLSYCKLLALVARKDKKKER